jgi:hypothetical protein
MRALSAASRGLRRGAALAAYVVPPLLRDLVGIAGAAAITFGVWQIHRPAAWIVAGIMMLLTALRLSAPSRREDD